MLHRAVRWFLAGLAIGATGTSPAAAEAGADAIRQILTGAPGWAVHIEVAPNLTPGERATRAGYQFFLRGNEVVGRTTALAEGFNCCASILGRAPRSLVGSARHRARRVLNRN